MIYSFLLLPFFYLIGKPKRELIPIAIAIYGILFFLQLYYFYDIPKSYRRFQQVIYTSLEYLSFAFLIALSSKEIRTKKFIGLFSVLFILFQILYFSLSSHQKVDSIPIGIETILIFVFSTVYFIEIFKMEKSDVLGPSFYIVVGILVYIGSNFFFNLLANVITQEQNEQYWHFTYIPEIIKNIIFAVSILFINTKTKIKNQEIAMPPGFLD